MDPNPASREPIQAQCVKHRELTKRGLLFFIIRLDAAYSEPIRKSYLAIDTIKMKLALLTLLLCTLNTAWAETDMQIQERALKARELSRQDNMDHSTHGQIESVGVFRGVFYGYLPCEDKDCDGLKMTLSLNARNNYTLVSQPAKFRNRESFEKGNYEWNEAKGTLLLTPKNNAPVRRMTIKDAETLHYLSSEGKLLPGDQERYLLKRSDTSDNRQMHIH